MLDAADEQAVREQFGVAREQVRKDHLISHVLAALSGDLAEQLLFFGGTALSRTFAPHGRLSEDIDLIALADRQPTAQAVEAGVLRALRREYPGVEWRPRLTNVSDAAPALLVAPDGVVVRVQLLSRIGYPPWPTEPHDLVQRYSDAPAARLIVPTVQAFAAWKTVAWADRKASRDLFDLWLLAGMDAINDQAVELFRRFGPTSRPPSQVLFSQAPDQQTWRRELAAQTRLTITAADALDMVRGAWASAI